MALLHCIIAFSTALQYCIALLHRSIALVLPSIVALHCCMHCSIALQYCIALLHFIAALHYSISLLHGIVALQYCVAALRCIIALLDCSVTTPRVDCKCRHLRIVMVPKLFTSFNATTPRDHCKSRHLRIVMAQKLVVLAPRHLPRPRGSTLTNRDGAEIMY